jgi:hypothetical protein
MAVDMPAVIVAGVGAWGSIMTVAVKGALDARTAKAQTNGAMHGPLEEIRATVSDLAADMRDVKADVRELKRADARGRGPTAS